MNFQLWPTIRDLLIVLTFVIALMVVLRVYHWV
jgi:hypothetical protein